MFERRCFWFAYAVPRRRTRTIGPHQMRDGEAALYLMSAWEVNILGAAPCEPVRRRKRAA